MNKLRLIRIFELRGKIHPIEQYIIDVLDGIGEFTIGENIYYEKDSKTYITYFLKSNNIYLYHICYKNLDNFGCSFEETSEIMKYLLEKHLKITINDVR